MHILKKRLYNEISKFSKILIYGAGKYADSAYTFLKRVGMRGKVGSFVVTKLNGIQSVDGIPVRCVNDITVCDDGTTVVLIAVSKVYEDEVLHTLQDHHCPAIIKFTDFMLDKETFMKLLNTQSDEQFLESIVDEMIWNDSTDISERFDQRRRELKDSIAQRNGGNADRNTIVIISGDMKPRIEKIIGALAKKKYTIIFLAYEYCNQLVIDEVESHDITFFYCRDIVDVFCKAIQHNPLAYYFEPIWGDCSGSEVMIRHKSLFGKIVFAPYDVLNDGYVQISEENKLMERYCLENADGIVWRWFSKEFLEEKKGFIYKGKSIQFLDYCNGAASDSNVTIDDRLKICFIIGNIHTELEDTVYKNDGIYTEFARIDTVLKKIGNRDDCIFHIFVGECTENEREKLDKLEREYINFQYFCGTSHRELIMRIAAYDYGCYMMTGGQDIPEMVSIDNMYYGSNYINAAGNRFFDYLDAGIPIIATRPKKQCEYFDSLGVLVKMDLSNMDIEYLKKNRDFYRKNVEKARLELLVDNQINRLINFLNALSDVGED